ncbi:MAG TPA: DUF6152 family protein [Croceibacterium sp.]
MKASLIAVAAGLAGAGIAAALPGQAHHAFATEFDSSKPLVIEGTVTRARLVNPHSWLYLDVKNADGSVTNWGFEFGTPLALKARGIERADVAFGTKVRLSGFRAKNGGAFGYAAVVAFADGRQVAIGGAPDAPALALR